MNIFFLADNTKDIAKYHTDRHCVKMVLETAQLLSTAHHVLDSEYAPLLYKPTHKNHPCAVWVRASAENYIWTLDLFKQLCAEYTYRYNKIHACEKLYTTLYYNPVAYKPNVITEFPQCMPEQYKHDNHIVAYRTYYTFEKILTNSKFSKRGLPDWYGAVYGGIKLSKGNTLCLQENITPELILEVQSLLEHQLQLNDYLNQDINNE